MIDQQALTIGEVSVMSSQKRLEKLHAGEPPAEVLGKSASTIPFEAIAKLSWTDEAQGVNIESGGKNYFAVVDSVAQRGELLRTLVPRLPGEALQSVREETPMESIQDALVFGIGTIVVVIIGIGAVMYFDTGDIEQMRARKGGGFLRLFLSFGIPGVLGIGFVALLGCAGYGYLKLKSPGSINEVTHKI